MNDVISKKEIIKHLKSDAIPVYVFDNLDSTNNFAKTLKEDFALVVANCQSNGRGRLNRSFYSPKGAGVYLSLKVKVDNLYQNVPFITTLAAVALHKAIHELFNINCGIKWVNDLYLNEKKVSGILCEIVDDTHAVIGIGVNLYPSPIPDDLKHIATSLLTHESNTTRNEFIALIAENLIPIISSLPDTSFMDYYKSHSIVIGKEITCIQGDKTFKAKAIDINSHGALLVENEEGIKKLSSGEISIRFNQFQNPADQT